MPKVIEVPNLGTVEFPDDTPDEAISSSITDHLDRVGKKAALGEEMAATRRERFAGDVGEKAIKGAEYFTQGVSKMFPTSAIGGVMDALGVQPPIPAEHVRQAREFISGLPARAEIPANVPTVGPAFDPGIEQGVNQFVDEMVSGLTRPDQAFSIAATGKFPAVMGRTFQLAPVIELPQQIQQMQQASESGDVAGTAKSAAGIASGALLPFAIQKGFNKHADLSRQPTDLSNNRVIQSAPRPARITDEDLQAQINELAADPGVTGKKLVSLDAEGNPIYQDQIIDTAKVRQLKNLQDLLAQGEIKTAQTKGKSNASQVPSPAEAHGDLQPSPIAGEGQVPAAEGGGGIQPQTSGGIPATAEPAQPARPREENQVPLNEQTPPTEANAPASVPSTETAGVSETAGSKSAEAKAPVTKSLKVGEAPTPADIHAATHEEFMAYHDAMKAPGEQRAAVNEFAKTLDENGIKEAERLAQVSRDKAKEIIGGDGPLETRFKRSMEENQRTQFLAEGARTAKAMKAVEEGSTPAEAAKKLGVPVSALETPKPPIAEVKAPAVEPVEVAKPIEPAKGLTPMMQQYKRIRDALDTQGHKDALLAFRLGDFYEFFSDDAGKAAKALNIAITKRGDVQMAGIPAHASEKYFGDLTKAGHKVAVVDTTETPTVGKPVERKVTNIIEPKKAASAKPATSKKAPASKQAELTFEEQKAEQAELNKAQAEEAPAEAAKPSSKFKMTYKEFLNAPRQGELMDELRKLPRREKTPEEVAAKERYDKAAEAVEKAGLGWIYSGDRQAELAARNLPKAKQKLVKEYNDALDSKVKSAPADMQQRLYDQLVKKGVIENPAKSETPRSYTSATEDESGRLYLNPIGPLIRTTLSDIRDFSHGVKKSAEWIIEKGREAAGLTKEAAKEGFNVGGKMNDYRRSVLNWSMKLQKSFGEAAHAQRDIQKRVPDSIRREAITNWIQADGDNTVLANRAATTTDKRLKKGYEIAQHLTPDEVAIARQIKGVYDALGMRGQAYGVINNFKENYVTQIWNLKNRLGGSARTLKDKFKYAKARTFDSFYDGEQAGYDPKTKDISKLLPSYLHEMNSVIAARQLVKQMQNGVAADGRPLLVPRGTGTPVSGPSGDATLITPKAVKGDTSDYKLLPNQPALNDWVWAAKDQAGNNIFLKADLMVHPKVYDKLKNTLGRSAIQEWYKSDTGPAAMLPKAIVQGLDVANNEAKRTMLGLASPFHQVQEGTHAIGHRVNPFSVPEIDLVGNPEQADAAKHGVMLLPDRASEAQFMEGFRASGLVSRIPILGRIADAYSNYLFHDYIPGLKFKTYQAILERNKSVFAKELANGAATLEDVKVLSAEQSNAAYGHLNYADLGRNPTISHIMRATIIAPDFLEARARFAGQAVKGATGFKVGREQVLALGFLALTQATAAYIIAKSLNGEWDKSHPFEFTKDNKRYTMRSVPEDVTSLIDNPRMFFNNRMTALASTLDQLRTGLDWKGDRISAGDTLKEAAQKPIPLSVRAMLKMGSKNLTALEQLAGSIGLKISSANPKMEKGIEIKDRTELLANKLRKLNRIERYKTAKDELKDLPPKDRNTVIDKLRRQGVFTYQ